ncbi:pre-16S rRNA-processing nuclease YqgF [bacterium]|nr:pre-16S rRNA-processing nuclease YqgF [bacterium]MBU1024638.1 pre-16S rRNA-processing nuclease YqgF [bacterium]
MTNPQSKTPNKILSIDPGTKKAGVAIVNKSGNPIFTKIINHENSFNTQLEKIIEKHKPDTIIIGNGTNSKFFFKAINSITNENIPIELIDETGSSAQARSEFFSEMPLLKRLFALISYALGFSRIEIDDRVAVILAN